MKKETTHRRIGELAEELQVEKFVIRFWEKEFGIKPHRTEGQQRFYSEKDIALFQQIKSLLYEQGFTIAGAKKQIQLERDHKTMTPSIKTTFEEQKPAVNQEITEQMVEIQKQLLKLRELL